MAYTLGLDFSTQSVTAVLLDITSAKIVHEQTLPFINWKDEYYLDSNTLTLKNVPNNFLQVNWNKGQHEQPPLMFLRALDFVCAKMRENNIALHEVKAISVSAQQHGHVYLNENFDKACLSLNENINANLEKIFRDSFSYPYAPIWMTSNTTHQTKQIRDAVGGSNALLEMSGSDCPERFSAAVIRRVGQEHALLYENTKHIHLLSSFFSAILSANANCPIDFGNASGMSLMSYQNKQWSLPLVEATAQGLSGGADALQEKLPPLSSAYKNVGLIAQYFVEKYGFSKECIVCAGSGDNPQTKTMVSGDLLSLGSSFVYMVEQSQVATHTDDKEITQQRRFVNAMYDGLDRAFSFACRTNGALLWDRARNEAGISLDEQEQLLNNTEIGEVYLWQQLAESFPLSKEIEPKVKITVENKYLYAALVDTTFALMRLFTSTITSTQDVYVTGGPSNSPALCQRLANILQRKIISIGSVGAGLGSAISAIAVISGKDEAIKVSKKIVASDNVYVPNVSLANTVDVFLQNVKNQIMPYVL